MLNDNNPKVALTHEFITQYGGAERVLQEFLNIYPEAPVFTLIYNGQTTQHLFGSYKIKTSFLQYLPWAKNHHKWFLSLMPWATESFNFKGFDIVLADTSAFSKGVKVSKGTMLVDYCHTPTRYLWTDSDFYVKHLHYPQPIKFLVQTILPPVLNWLRSWDKKAAQRPDFYIANSKTVQERIKRIYNRDSVVVYPPVDTEFFHPLENKENYFFVASRLEPYKKIELVIQAFNELGLPLKVAGAGTSSESLRKMAKPNIEFLGRVSDEELRRRYSEAQAFIFPANEDAGIMPIEAMSCGTPVIAFRAGGATETVVEGKTGIFFDEQSTLSLKEAIANFKPENFNRADIRQHALQFDKYQFRARIKGLIDNWYQEFKKQ